MISLHIEAQTAEEMRSQLLGLVAMIQAGDAAAATDKPATTRARKPNEDPVVEQPVKEEPKKSVFDDGETTDAPPITKDDLIAQAMKFGQAKGDEEMAAVVAKFSSTGKISGIAESDYPAAHAALALAL